jgi:hypothetical protein
MKQYEGLKENDWKIIIIALQKLPITGVEAPMIANLMKKVQMEAELSMMPKESRPQVGDIVQEEQTQQ